MDFVKEHLETQKMINFGDSQELPNNIELEILADTVYVRVSGTQTLFYCVSTERNYIAARRFLWRRCGHVVSALVSGSSGPGLIPGLGHCVVFSGKTLYSHSSSLHPGV